MNIKELAESHRFKTRVDSDLTTIIPGKVGHIYEYDDDLMGVMVMPDPPRKQYWGFTKRTLVDAGLTLVQDGDGEGAATFNPSNESQVKAAKRAAGIRSRRIPSPEQLERLARIRPRLAGKAG